MGTGRKWLLTAPCLFFQMKAHVYVSFFKSPGCLPAEWIKAVETSEISAAAEPVRTGAVFSF